MKKVLTVTSVVALAVMLVCASSVHAQVPPTVTYELLDPVSGEPLDLRTLELDVGETVTLEPGDVEIRSEQQEGIFAQEDHGWVVALDTQLDDALAYHRYLAARVALRRALGKKPTPGTVGR